MSILERAADRLKEQEAQDASADDAPAEQPEETTPSAPEARRSSLEAALDAAPSVASPAPLPSAPSPEPVVPPDPAPSPLAATPPPAPPAAGTLVIDEEGLAEKGFINRSDPRCKVTRQFRRIKRPLLMNYQTMLASAGSPELTNIVMVTSSVPREGKTYVSINLAMSMAQEIDRTVLLISADAIQRGSETVLETPVEPGFSEVLAEQISYDEAILPTSIPSLSFMPSGANHQQLDELMASEAAERILRQMALEAPNRLIVIDTAPLMARSETAVLARLCGQVVMVVEARQTPRAVVNDAISQVRKHPRLQVVMNKSTDRLRLFGKYDSYGYGYGYGYG